MGPVRKGPASAFPAKPHQWSPELVQLLVLLYQQLLQAIGRWTLMSFQATPTPRLVRNYQLPQPSIAVMTQSPQRTHSRCWVLCSAQP